ncbi:MBL fold metallo-hydrolase [Kibdelosporangium philippinense]|uniref:MBL fold metallo-hydrolase n=1 Tax=Kibdelosporangium philippinense TaxID=211113 RepID=A0ABS8ZNP0_9PSEU|nr:MBL fold metallo-hydrolase [Kibdelosporangium philippinense]MCE7009359.1 MBL fold metallo-hydrolase [Kibdelosporangium philippinense]
MKHPAYGVLREVTPTASVMLEDNPGHMTLDGTNTWLLRGPDASDYVVVDPGYEDIPHLTRVAATGPISLILVTHHHADHVGGAPKLAELTGAPIRAFDRTLCRDAPPVSHGEVVSAAGLELTVLHTPGHTDDSVCFQLSDAVLTGDTILGRGTTVISSLGHYLDTLRLLRTITGAAVLPGHGEELPDLAAVASEYLVHREERLAQVRAALDQLGPDASARQVVEVVYADVDKSLWEPAEWSVRAQLEYLRSIPTP